ncbi:unnamed protein product, partial [Amoebophrya sp. A25]
LGSSISDKQRKMEQAAHGLRGNFLQEIERVNREVAVALYLEPERQQAIAEASRVQLGHSQEWRR